ncbi:MAG: YbaK/EbsC family protein, partial [Desulfatitalea sp.]|nr:YbaK/EbsC family protein [Desulfatitalea sp.]
VSAEQVTEALGFEVGGIGPFPVHEALQVVVDTQIRGSGHVVCGSGLKTRSVEIDADHLIQLSKALVTPIAKAVTERSDLLL